MPIYAYEHVGIPGKGCPKAIEVFQTMSEGAHEKCPDCGRALRKLVNWRGAMAVKAAPEKPGDSVKRVLKEKRKHFDCPWPDAQTGKNKRVYLKGSKAEQKRQIQDAILNTKIAQRRKLQRSDINPINL